MTTEQTAERDSRARIHAANKAAMDAETDAALRIAEATVKMEQTKKELAALKLQLDLPKDSSSVAVPSASSTPVRLSMKIPEFSCENVTAWFHVVQAQFRIADIKDEVMKFTHVLSALPSEIAGQLSPEVLSSDSFEEIKTALLNVHAKSKSELFEQLVSTNTISAGEKPTQRLLKLRAAASRVNCGEDLVRHNFIKCLPPSLKVALGAHKEMSLEQLGQLADDLLPLALASSGAVAAVERRDFFPQRRHRGRSNDRSAGDGFRRPPGDGGRRVAAPPGVLPYKEGQRPRICRAHLYYGLDALNCKPWCQFPSKPSTSASRSSSRPPSRPSSPRPKSGNDERE